MYNYMGNSEHAALFDTGRFSNLVVRLGTKTWKVHRNILCTASGLFNKACEGEWKEAVKQEIELHEDHEAVVTEMLRYMYTSEYDYNISGSEDFNPLEFEVHTFAIGEKYTVRNLPDQAAAKFTLAASSHWDAQHFTEAVVYATKTSRKRTA